MKIAVLSDIHSNYLALERVVQHANEQGARRYWVLGDVLGYGPYPVECLQWMQANIDKVDWVLGNHEAIMLGLYLRRVLAPDGAGDGLKQKLRFALRELDETQGDIAVQPASVSPEAGAALQQAPRRDGEAVGAAWLNLQEILATEPTRDFWERNMLSEKLGPQRISLDGGDYMLVHASHRPGQEIDLYLYPWLNYSIEKEMDSLYVLQQERSNPVCLLHGHTHVPYVCRADGNPQHDLVRCECVEIGKSYPLGKCVTLMNPGSLGQPRNGDTRACYALVDTAEMSVIFYRVGYELDTVVEKLTRKGYPNNLVWRLCEAPYPRGKYEPSVEWQACMARQKQAGEAV